MPRHRTPRSDGTRWCPHCKRYKPRGEFSSGSQKDGLATYCRPCDRAWQDARRRAEGQRRQPNRDAPTGTAWCPRCRRYVVGSIRGRPCKPCAAAYAVARRGGYKTGPRGPNLQLPITSGQRRCRRCGAVMALACFYIFRSKKTGRRYYQSTCHECFRQEKLTVHLALRQSVLVAYGGHCRCCGETTPAFLCVDHIHGDGSQHRRELSAKNPRGGNSETLYRWLRAHHFPRDRFQLLCFNCNMAKHILGRCPHQDAAAREHA